MYRSLVQCDINFGQTKEEEMKLIDFISKFPDEESCRTKLREYRERHGVVCPRCGSILHYWKRDKECFECKSCHYRQSLKANTVMHGSQLPVSGQVLVHSHAPADKHEEEHIGVRAPASARP